MKRSCSIQLADQIIGGSPSSLREAENIINAYGAPSGEVFEDAHAAIPGCMSRRLEQTPAR